jgi:Domain of unknown function (DUF4386)
MEQEMDETTRTAVLVAEAPAEAPRLRYDNGREVVQEELSSTRRTARIVGMLVLGGYLTYGVGNAIATGIAAAPDYLSNVATSTLFTASAVWMLLNSALVIGIGALMLPILRPHNKNIALGYFATRVFEGIILAVGVISLLSLVIVSRSYTEAGAADASYFGTLGALAINGNFMAYNVAMVGLGLGSLFFCYLLFRSNLVPRFLAIWGLVGYAIFATGCVLEILGFAGTGLVATIPGGLFEIFFGIWLIAKGFNPSAITIGAAKTAGVLTP